MERMLPDRSLLLATYEWRLYKASSIADMVNSKDAVEAEIETEHTQYVAGLDIRGRLNHAKTLFILLWASPDSFTHLVLGRIPSIHAAPRSLVFLPRVDHYPAQDEGLKGGKIKINDVTGSTDVAFPYGATASIGRALGYNVDRQTARETSWSSPVVLFNAYGPWPESFLMHIYKFKSTEKAKEKVRQLIPRSAFDPQGA